MTTIYLDNSATTQPLPQVVHVVQQALEHDYGNPASLHRMGLAAEKIVRRAREAVAASLKVPPATIYFTSGGTEANNWALWGLTSSGNRKGQIIASSSEHASILLPLRRLAADGWKITFLPVDTQGSVSLAQLETALQEPTLLVVIMLVNNEVGTIQPIAQIAAILRQLARPPLLLVDAIQGWGKIPVEPGHWGVDLLSLSGHKIHGPKGAGALYIRKGITLTPLLLGGGQEHLQRAGTENVPGIAGLGAAAALAQSELAQSTEHLSQLKLIFWQAVHDIAGIKLNGPPVDQSAPHILNLSFPDLQAEVLLRLLEDRGIMVSTGSACHSRRPEPSHVLRAMGLKAHEIAGSLRVSFARTNNRTEVLQAAAHLHAAVAELRSLLAKK